MTSYSRGSPYGRKHSTEFHLIYRIENGKLVSLGLYETREQAEEELALVNTPSRRPDNVRPCDWKIADVTCRGWGVIDGVVSRNKRDKDEELDWETLLKPEDETLWTDWQRDA
jgi:hypothetical protein